MEMVWLGVGFLLFGVGIYLYKLDYGDVKPLDSQWIEDVFPNDRGALPEERYSRIEKSTRIQSTSYLDVLAYVLTFIGFLVILYFGVMILTGSASFQ